MMTQSEAKLRLIAEYAKWLREVWEPENAGKHLTDGDYIESYPNPCDTLRERPSRSRTLQGIPI